MTVFRLTVLPIVGATALISVAAAQQGAKPPATTAAPAGDAHPTLLGQYADWGAYTASPTGGKVCFALSKPISSKTEPAGRKRDAAYIFVATRPAENVKNELSVIVGYQFKSTSDATAELGTVKFEMYTKNGGAWIKRAADEARMIDAMRKGPQRHLGRRHAIDRPVFTQGPCSSTRPSGAGVQISALPS